MSSVPTTKILWVAFGLMTIPPPPNGFSPHLFHLDRYRRQGSSIWIRDLQWILTFPLVLVELGLISGVSIQDLVIMVSPGAYAFVMELRLEWDRNVCNRLPGNSPKANRLRWPLVLMAWIFWLSIVREILTSGRRSSARNSARVARFFNYLAVYVVVLGSFYPISGVDPFLEIALFSILDMLTNRFSRLGLNWCEHHTRI
ncbi:hypothetical protein KEM48_008182 [Puccinia striiformis f. sp. tritici PST-130]|nr:hypothetical protein KEM48_008182 [Puccinia striiformis f. sp. tritici PST-130]